RRRGQLQAWEWEFQIDNLRFMTSENIAPLNYLNVMRVIDFQSAIINRTLSIQTRRRSAAALLALLRRVAAFARLAVTTMLLVLGPLFRWLAGLGLVFVAEKDLGIDYDIVIFVQP